jgi:transitional endoplasmic reticulum ATPase
MSKTLSEVETQVARVEIVNYGEQLILPEKMTLRQGIDVLQRREKYEQEETAFSDSYNVFPFDGANALQEVLIAKYGWAPATFTPSMFGKQPPQMIRIEVAPNVFKEVPWGRFSLPNIKGYIETSWTRKDGRVVFAIEARILRMNEKEVRSLFEDVRTYLKTGSIYKGQAIKLRFRDNDGEVLQMPEPKFMDVSKIDPNGLIYAHDVQDAVETNLFTPIRRVQDCLDNGVNVKRGVLLGGAFGTGKTMAAQVASRLAVDNGLTYVYVPRADELSDAIEFAKQYQSPACVIFCEDIDRSTNGKRSVEMDDILNLLDGIDTKNSHIITVVTTNDLEAINPALLRPGRLDAVINVTPPDAGAVEKLLRYYGGDSIEIETDLSEAGAVLAEQKIIPAVLREVVQRAKLAEIKRQGAGCKVRQLSAESLLEAAKTLAAQVALLNPKKVEDREPTLREIVEQSVAKYSEANEPALLHKIDKIVAAHT